jgi:hypothetical protein
LDSVTVRTYSNYADVKLFNTVGDFAFAYNVEMTANDITKPALLNYQSDNNDENNHKGIIKFGVGVFIGSGMDGNIIRTYNDSKILIYAGTMGGNVAPTDGYVTVKIGGEDGLDVNVIAGYAFSYNIYVNKIIISSGVKVNANAFFNIGEQLQIINLLNTYTDCEKDASVSAFNGMLPCELYVIADTISNWKDKFANIESWFRLAA